MSEEMWLEDADYSTAKGDVGLNHFRGNVSCVVEGLTTVVG